MYIFEQDPYLKPYAATILRRYEKAQIKAAELQDKAADFQSAFNDHLYYGLHKTPAWWVMREYMPNATALYLIGDFSGWQPMPEYQFQKKAGGEFELTLPAETLSHLSLYKLYVEWYANGQLLHGERLSAWSKRCVQDPQTFIFSSQVWDPQQPYQWQHNAPSSAEAPLIYEAHVGMASERGEVASFAHFTQHILPYIADLGYNAVQLMAIQEHPYYGSFGYQVSNFFAVSSRFGTPDELKELIDTAHALGLRVIMDIVHSHAVSNEVEGLGCYDGSDHLFCHSGKRGQHSAWNSRCFDYGKDNVLHFLLANCKYWLEEFRFDGFRFDGVTSMLYLDHGLNRDFLGYADYFDRNTDEDATTYLFLANKLIHELRPHAITIAEDVSGMPGLAAPRSQGGMGFDYRLAMGMADHWIKLLKEVSDEFWDVGNLYYRLTDHRQDEKTITYAECHDQSLVGDQTLFFRMAGEKIYQNMSVFTPSIEIDRAIALHKIIRLLTISTAGNGYLNFMGNEFGHPEWIDFPRAGNNNSYHYARRQWSLAQRDDLKYKYLLAFDRAIIALAKAHHLFDYAPNRLFDHKADQVLAYMRGDLLFVVNLSPAVSYFEYGLPAPVGDWHICLSTDSPDFGGYNSVDTSLTYTSDPIHHLRLYLPARIALVLQRGK